MPAPDTLLIINPAARHGETAKLVPVIEQLLANVPHDTVITERMGHATEVARPWRELRLVVAAGGDGTVHEVLNGLMSHPPEAARARRAADRVGQRHAPHAGYPDRSRPGRARAVDRRGPALRRRSVQRGLLQQLFAAGLDAKVTAKAVEYKVTTGRSGLWLYLTALLHVLFNDLGSFDMRDRVRRRTLRALRHAHHRDDPGAHLRRRLLHHARRRRR